MSRTRNSDPYTIQARREPTGAVHRCQPDGDPAWPCTIDAPYDPTRPRALRFRHCFYVTDHPGGHRGGQSGWATLAERAERCRVRGLLTATVKAANGFLAAGDIDGLDDLDVPTRRRDISWDLW